MRSDLVYGALKTVQNRYTLCQVASKSTRKFHRPNTRIQETTNEVLTRIATADPQTVIGERETKVAEAQRRAA
jgi:ribosomal protein S3